MKLGLHNHSNYSDGLYSVRSILKSADKAGLDVVAITDHNEIRGSLKAFELRNDYKVDILLGIEIFFWYRKKITELLVYFREPQEIIGFYQEFIGTNLIPTVQEVKTLENIVKKHNGLVVMPHPKALKGCIKNGFDYPTKNIETMNHISRGFQFPTGTRDFGGADLHIYKRSLGVYSELVDGTTKEDIFDESFTIRAVEDANKMSHLEKMLQRLVVAPLDIKYILSQLVRKKIYRKTP